MFCWCLITTVCWHIVGVLSRLFVGIWLVCIYSEAYFGRKLKEMTAAGKTESRFVVAFIFVVIVFLGG